ncbi:MAG: TolC family protein [Gemmatimonadales bacterium]
MADVSPRLPLVLGLVLLAGPAAAQDRPVISLEEAIERSQRVQPRVVQALGQVSTSDARIRSTKGAWLPNLSFSSSASNFYSEGQRVDPVTGQLVSSNSSNTSINGTVSTNIELFDGFRRSADSRAARASHESALEGLDDARFQQQLQTTNQFFDVLAAAQLVRVREASVRRAEEQLNVSIARLRAGAAIRSDSLRSLVTLGSARVQLIQAQTQLATAEANLGRLVGYDGRVSAQDDSTFYRVVTDVEGDALRVEALNRSPQVRAAEAAARAAQASVGVGRSGYWPTVSLSGSASLNGSQQTDYNFLQQRNVALRLSWDIFNRFQREQTIANQVANAQSAEATASETQREVQANLTTRLAELAAAETRIGIAQTSLAAATEDLRVQQERYRLGVATIVDVLTSQESLTQAEVDLVTARFDYLRAKAQIEALIGRDL